MTAQWTDTTGQGVQQVKCKFLKETVKFTMNVKYNTFSTTYILQWHYDAMCPN